MEPKTACSKVNLENYLLVLVLSGHMVGEWGRRSLVFSFLKHCFDIFGSIIDTLVPKSSCGQLGYMLASTRRTAHINLRILKCNVDPAFNF